MEKFNILSEDEIRSFASRLEVDADNLRHIIEPMDGIAGINLRQELERWVADHQREKERTKGMTLEQLVADTRATLIPSMTATLRRAQEHLAALDKEEEEKEEDEKHSPEDKAALHTK